MTHQAAMADGVQDGSMRDDTVPGDPPGDASRSVMHKKLKKNS